MWANRVFLLKALTSVAYFNAPNFINESAPTIKFMVQFTQCRNVVSCCQLRCIIFIFPDFSIFECFACAPERF